MLQLQPRGWEGLRWKSKSRDESTLVTAGKFSLEAEEEVEKIGAGQHKFD